MAASSETPAQSPTGPGDREPPRSRPKVRRRRRRVIAGTAVIVTAGLVAAGIAVRRTGPQDPGEKIAQPHRAALTLPQPAAGQPRWAVPDHHWTVQDGTLFALGDGVAIIDRTTGKTVFQRPAAHHDRNDTARQGRAVPAGGHIVVFDDKGGITGYH
ncbi:hypothetical protein GCM10027176_40970 [Actinoallomurus bryophytorum]|uniref:Uncharacterized protein n=1 Tax=Actinoallomurus bryophytorum TaxID=1490222 RepID=A0A543C1I3_9ACTN|nr:hypothetical protein [Actinoallomurus bryophytorum]TQL90939.1 hypothetical protein FB559_8258 [Actinoallomurus bryophytorum]